MVPEQQLRLQVDGNWMQGTDCNPGLPAVPRVARRRFFDRLSGSGTALPAISSTERARRVELLVAETLLEAFRTGLVRR
jgi:hypothetical protein